jgi:hypothetical protein
MAMKTTTMVSGVMAMLWLIGCGDAATGDAGHGAQLSNGEAASGEVAPSTSSSNADPSANRGTGSSANPSADPNATADGGSPDASPPPPPAPVDCSTRTNGALITLEKDGETRTLWITNSKFNTEAFLATAQGSAVTPVFNKVIDGVDCDGNYTWYVDGDDVAFEADYDPSCDVLPSVVEANKAKFVASGRWCPSKVLFSSFQSQ